MSIDVCKYLLDNFGTIIAAVLSFQTNESILVRLPNDPSTQSRTLLQNGVSVFAEGNRVQILKTGIDWPINFCQCNVQRMRVGATLTGVTCIGATAVPPFA